MIGLIVMVVKSAARIELNEGGWYLVASLIMDANVKGTFVLALLLLLMLALPYISSLEVLIIRHESRLLIWHGMVHSR